MLPVTPRMSSRPPSATTSVLGGVLVLEAIAYLGVGDLLQRHAGRLLVLGFELRLRAAVELARPLGSEHDEQIAIGHLVERPLQGRERHQSGTSTSGNRMVSRLVRQRSAWMMVASWSTASFTSRLMIR